MGTYIDRGIDRIVPMAVRRPAFAFESRLSTQPPFYAHNFHITMNKDDPFLAFCVSLMRTEVPNLTDSMAITAHLWIQNFIDGRLLFSEIHKLATQDCGSANFIERIQQILSVPDEPLPDPTSSELASAHRTTIRDKRRCWTIHEDNRLLAGIRRFGMESAWSTIADFVGSGRTRSQCSQRWIRVLDPRISKAEWTDEEDKRLLELVVIYGEKAWMKVADQKGDRSDVQCRYRYLHLEAEEKKKKTTPQTAIDPSHTGKVSESAGDSAQGVRTNRLVMPILGSSSGMEGFSGAEFDLGDISLESPIPLTMCLDLRKSDPYFDPSTWLWKPE
jgi:hypothetical protein